MVTSGYLRGAQENSWTESCWGYQSGELWYVVSAPRRSDSRVLAYLFESGTVSMELVVGVCTKVDG